MSGPRRRRIAQLLSASVAPFVRFDLPRLEQFPSAAPVLWAPNHRSMFDIVVGLVGLDRMGLDASLLVNERYFARPTLGRLLTSAGAIPIDPSDGPLRGFGLAADCLAAGRSVVIMPEGRLVGPEERIDGVGQLGRGVAVLAKRRRVPIVPVAIVGSDAVVPIGARVPRVPVGSRHRILVRFGEPVTIEGRPREGVVALRRALSAVVLATEAEAGSGDG